MLIDVLLPGAAAVTQMDETHLLRLEGGFENEQEAVSWVQYHLRVSGEMVHRSAHIRVKQVSTYAVANIED